MTGFRSNGGCYCFRISHFANHQNIRILTQNRTQSLVKIRDVKTNLPLRNNGSVLNEKIFNRVFNGDNVVGALVIDFVNNRGQGG